MRLEIGTKPVTNHINATKINNISKLVHLVFRKELSLINKQPFNVSIIPIILIKE